MVEQVSKFWMSISIGKYYVIETFVNTSRISFTLSSRLASSSSDIPPHSSTRPSPIIVFVLITLTTIVTSIVVRCPIFIFTIFKLIKYGCQLFCSIVKNITTLCLWCLKLVKNALSNKVEDVGKASGLVCSTREHINKGCKVVNHLVVVWGIITGETQYLPTEGTYFD